MTDADGKDTSEDKVPSAAAPGHAYRRQARETLAKARAHLARGDVDFTILGCLFMRMSVEALAYDLLLAYRREAPFAAMKAWQPHRVIAELLAIDDRVDVGSTIEIRLPGGEVLAAGEEKRFKARWASSAHNALSSFLHVPTIKRAEAGAPPSVAEMRAKAEAIAATLDGVLASPIFNFNAGQFVELGCPCGFAIRRKMTAMRDEGELRCGECGRYWHYSHDHENARFRFEEPSGAFACTRCGERLAVTRYDAERGNPVDCACGARHKMAIGFSPLLCADEGEAGASADGGESGKATTRPPASPRR